MMSSVLVNRAQVQPAPLDALIARSRSSIIIVPWKNSAVIYPEFAGKQMKLLDSRVGVRRISSARRETYQMPTRWSPGSVANSMHSIPAATCSPFRIDKDLGFSSGAIAR
jgi:hypothetical protein